MIAFINEVRRVLHEISETGGDPLEAEQPSPQLIIRLKKFAVEQFNVYAPKAVIPPEIEQIYDANDLFNFSNGEFDERVRVSNIFLKKAGVYKEGEVYKILSNIILKKILDWAFPNELSNILDFDPLKKYPEETKSPEIFLVLDVWNNFGDTVTKVYTSCNSRSLISWNSRSKKWRITNLGRFVLDLNDLHMLSIMLTVDLCLGAKHTGTIPRNVMENLLRGPCKIGDPLSQLSAIRLAHLDLMHIIEVHNGKVLLTPLGKRVLNYVINDNNPFVDMILLLIESEEYGLNYKGLCSEFEKMEHILDVPLLDDTDRQSIKNALLLCQRKEFVDALKILFPCIERVINKMLEQVGAKPDSFPGWRKKIEYLESIQAIPPDVAQAVEIITSRNKTLHGQFVPPDPEYALPLLHMTLIYLRRILSVWRNPR